ncbi:hypothetical protein [Pseudomonas citronellolis]|uniref:hypothetical protein n=1 Tax=Pseudomonas citronellolis TaxID=53408 RepID=UPI000778AD02|nr:hypothetical protein [Pseudomonas citronellolis]AMO78061.1 hypothetical protein PcP3B5_46690 [Pseudomonas citronellolis]
MNAVQHFKAEEEDSLRREYLTEQVAQLLKGNDADNVLFFTKTRPQVVQGFADAVMELLGELGGRECPVVQILIALEQDKPELASAIYHARLREHIVALAEQIIQERAA